MNGTAAIADAAEACEHYAALALIWRRYSRAVTEAELIKRHLPLDCDSDFGAMLLEHATRMQAELGS